MQQISFITIGQHRGRPRLWVEGGKLANAGMTPGTRFSVEFDRDGAVLRLRADKLGERTVSSRTRGERVTPIVDINAKMLEQAFPNGASRVRMCLSEGLIEVEVHPDDAAAAERVQRLATKLANGESLAHGELCVGGGIMCDALHEGLSRAGVQTHTAFAVEKESAYLEQFLKNDRVVDDRTLAVCGGIQEVAPGDLPRVEILSAGLPCVGASKSGKTKNKLDHAEAHPLAGNLFVSFLNIVKATNPAVVMLENVVPYENTVSMVVIENTLKGWGYDVSMGRVDERLGALEARERMVMVATSGDMAFDFDTLRPSRTAETTLGECLEDIPLDDPSWREYGYLIDKQARDIAAGKGFRMNVVGPEATSVGTLGAGYSKVRSTECKVRHPANDRLMRQLTPVEHARVKGAPERLIDGVPATRAHEMLGNGVLWPAFVSVGVAMGQMLSRGAAVVERVAERTVAVAEATALEFVDVGGDLPPDNQMDMFGMAA